MNEKFSFRLSKLHSMCPGENFGRIIFFKFPLHAAKKVYLMMELFSCRTILRRKKMKYSSFFLFNIGTDRTYTTHPEVTIRWVRANSNMICCSNAGFFVGSVVTIDQIRQDAGEKFTVRQKLYLTTILMAKFVHQLCSFWGAIVYPIEAQQRNFTLVEIGFMLVFISIAR